MHLVNRKDVEKVRTRHGKLLQWLIPCETSGSPFEMRYVEVLQESVPSEESHVWEHQVYVVSGEGFVTLAGVEYPLNPGDALYIAPDEPHSFRNDHAEPLGFICTIPAGSEDRVKPDSIKQNG